MWRHKVSTLANPKLANHGLVRAAQDLDDFAVGAAILFDSRDVHHHAVAVHGRLRRLARDVDVAAQAFDRMVGNQKSVAIAMHVQAANRVFAAEAGDHKVTGANFDELAALNQAVESVLQFIARCNAGAEFPDQLFKRRPGMRQTRDMFKDDGVGHRDWTNPLGVMGSDRRRVPVA